MESLGNFLKNQRQTRGYSLEDAQEETKIQIKYLQALEEEKFEVLPGEVFARGFLRSYADFLGLNSEEVLKRYQNLKGEKNEIENSKEVDLGQKEENTRTVSLREIKEERVEKVKRGNKLVPIILGAILIIALGSWSYNKFTSPPSSTQKEPPKQQVKQNQISNERKEKAVPLPAPVYLKTIVNEDCWMQVIIDGKTAFAGELAPGTIREWKAQEEISLRLGNAGGVQVKYNGKDLGFLGGKGEVVKRTFTP